VGASAPGYASLLNSPHLRNNYAAAKEKCDAMSGDAKKLCMNEAKKHYDK
jgi:hypothetical protein